MNIKRSAAFPYSIFPLTFLVWALLCLPERAFGESQTITATGTVTYTAPSEITIITVEVWGDGRRGGIRSGAGESSLSGIATAGTNTFHQNGSTPSSGVSATWDNTFHNDFFSEI